MTWMRTKCSSAPHSSATPHTLRARTRWKPPGRSSIRCSPPARRPRSTPRAAGDRSRRRGCSGVRAAGTTRARSPRTGRARAHRHRRAEQAWGLIVRADATVSEDEIVRSPAWLPLEGVGGDAMRLVHLDEAAYREASFLDQRILGCGYEQKTSGLAILPAAPARRPPPLPYH